MAKSTKSQTKSQTNLRPISEKRLAANRANAARSTGPRTAEGKTRSAQNARKHGFAASSYAVVRLEDVESVARLRADLIAVYQPVNSQELFAIERMALAQQSLLRAAQLEASLFTLGMNDVVTNYAIRLETELTDDQKISYGQNRGFFMAEGFRQLITRGKGDPWRLFLRYQAQAERQYRRALEEFERLKALRNELPNEPTVDPETEEKIDRFAPSPEPVEDEREPSASSLEEPSPHERQPINGRLIH